MNLEPEVSVDVEDGGQCLCGRPSTEGGAEDEELGLQIECDICHIWYHVRCVGLGPMGANAIDKYHCPRCETMCGASLMKLRTNSHRHDCTDPDARTKATQVGTQDFIEELQRRTFQDALVNIVAQVQGTQLTLPYLNQTIFRNPVFVDHPEGLDLCMPDPDFSISDVPRTLGHDIQVDVIDVHTQDTRLMSLSAFCSSFEIPLEERAMSEVFNCLSLEVSDTPLGDQIEPPSVVRKLCWVNNVWPQQLGNDWDDSLRPPQVEKYCIMSMKDSFTDFHIDFGGTSVWYHIFKGEKIFYLIEPTSTNLSLYERWQRLSSQSETFLGDMVDRCYRLRVKQGQTVLIPTGWIHAVYTPKDSIVFGGNFLHSLNIQLQLKVCEIEDRIRTPKKFRFPSLEAVHWLAAQKLKNDLSDLNSDSTLCPSHLLGGIKALLQTLRTWLQDLDNRPCPSSIDPHGLVRDLGKEVRLAERISNKCNPPKPERESKRKKQKKELNQDFIDITHGSALFFLTGRSPQKKKAPAKAKSQGTELLPVTTTVPMDILSTSESPEANKKKPPKKRPPKKATAADKAAADKRIKLKLPTRPVPLSELGPEMGFVTEPIRAPNPFDLTNQDSVRQLISTPRQNLRQLNTALDAALAGFDYPNNDEEEGLVIDENPSPRKYMSKASELKLKLNMPDQPQQKKKTATRSVSRTTLEDMRMTKVHQDDDYIYPSLDFSDDEMDIGPNVTQAKDDAWNPKVRVKNVGSKSEPRPTRDGAKKMSVEMGLKVAAERRRKPKITVKKKSGVTHKKSPSIPISTLNATKIDDSPAPNKPVPRKSFLLSPDPRPGITPSKFQISSPISSSQLKKSKKGMLTAKQRIAKTLGLKF